MIIILVKKKIVLLSIVFFFCNCHNSSDIKINSKSRFISLATTDSTETNTTIMNNVNATPMNFKISF